MFSSLACLRAAVCSTARDSGVVNSPLTTAESLIRCALITFPNNRLARLIWIVEIHIKFLECCFWGLKQ